MWHSRWDFWICLNGVNVFFYPLFGFVLLWKLEIVWQQQNNKKNVTISYLLISFFSLGLPSTFLRWCKTLSNWFFMYIVIRIREAAQIKRYNPMRCVLKRFHLNLFIFPLYSAMMARTTMTQTNKQTDANNNSGNRTMRMMMMTMMLMVLTVNGA